MSIEYKNSRTIAGVSQVTRLALDGYLARRIGNNEQCWLQHAIENNPDLFRIYKNRDSDPRCVVPWFGEYPGKILTGMAFTYRMSADTATLKAGNELVTALTTVQGEDGYLGPHPIERRLNGLMHEDAQAVFNWMPSPLWDVWGHYHEIYGLYQWYAATGNEQALHVACRAADCLCDYFVDGQRPFSSAGEPDKNLSAGHALLLLYRETGVVRYRLAAEQIVSEWQKDGCGNWMNEALEGKEFYESDQHRWEALHCVMTLAELYRTTKDEQYFKALEHIWESIQQLERHNTGGFSSGEGAVGNPYRLMPIEYCCTVAWMALSTEYLKLSHRSIVADEMELSFFNAALGGLTENDYIFTYDVPMNGPRKGADTVLRWQTTADDGRDLNCCQANGSRGLTQVADWAAFSDDTGLYLNFYSPCTMTVSSPSGQPITFVQNTEYPLNGKVTINVHMDQAETCPIHFRVPGWSKQTRLSVNGVAMYPQGGTYCTVDRTWNDGDAVVLELDMSPYYWVGGGEVDGYTSVYYGPILLALDSLASGVDINTVAFKQKDLDEMVVRGDALCWLKTDVRDVNGQTVTLVDFADCGRNGSDCISWMSIEESKDIANNGPSYWKVRE